MNIKKKAEKLLSKTVQFCEDVSEVFSKVDEINKGMGCVLFYLKQNESRDVCAGELAERIKVSPARITKILKKLESENLIAKCFSITDKRQVCVRITKEGSQKVSNLYEEILKYFEFLIDEIGEEELNVFFATAQNLRDITKKYKN